MHFLYEMEELVPIVAALSEKYTSKESTSVSYETARQLMEAVMYCINECSSDQALVSSKKLSAVEAYRYGYEALVEKVKQTQINYNQMIVDFCGYGNRNYEETVEKAIPGFFLYYDVQFAPQETIITMDYPTICPVSEKSGIDAIETYVKYISYEQKFMGAFPRQYVYEVLERDRTDHKNGFENICRVILRNVLGHLLIRKGFLEEASGQDYEKLCAIVTSSSDHQLREVLEGLLEQLIHEKYDDDLGMKNYFACDIADLVVEMKNAAENDVMTGFPMMR
ncbi:MAG: DUF6179 domain-containing protein [Lachnospiraceae bacterium]|nr:DUF6179 domain-containing protein [Lachnospiraceae bacterium]MDD7177348.1 DUF6179 domain-containing protein [bacterium]MDY5518480.1 DUF6179 domain-containing protein [Lachnospiraceae bacterium]